MPDSRVGKQDAELLAIAIVLRLLLVLKSGDKNKHITNFTTPPFRHPSGGGEWQSHKKRRSV